MSLSVLSDKKRAVCDEEQLGLLWLEVSQCAHLTHAAFDICDGPLRHMARRWRRARGGNHATKKKLGRQSEILQISRDAEIPISKGFEKVLGEKMRKYRCRVCGSQQVYHHCSGTRKRTIGIPVATIRKTNREPTTVVFSPTAKEVETSEEHVEKKDPAVALCDICDRPRDRQLRGFRWINGKVTPVPGDSLCNACYCEARDEIDEYIPHPGRSKPVCQLVGLAKDQKAFVIERAITMAWCFGRAHRAARLKKLMSRIGSNTMVKISDIV